MGKKDQVPNLMEVLTQYFSLDRSQDQVGDLDKEASFMSPDPLLSCLMFRACRSWSSCS